AHAIDDEVSAERDRASGRSVECHRSTRMLLHPIDELVHPALQELLAVRIRNAALRIEEPIADVQEDLGLAQRRHIQIAERVAQMLLRDRGADRADRATDDAGGLAIPGALAIGTRGMIERVLENAGH